MRKAGEGVCSPQPISAIALEANGQILLATGGFPFPNVGFLPIFPPTGSVARYNSNGSLDPSFGGLGQVACLPSASAMVVQPNGKIVVAGSITSQLVAPPSANQTGFGLVRLNASGSIDTTFGTRGVVITGFTAAEPNALAGALALQSNGDIVAAGFASTLALNGNMEMPSVFALTRYSHLGTLDATFSSGGTLTTSFSSSASIAAMVVQSDSKIVVVGNSGVDAFTVARYLGE